MFEGKRKKQGSGAAWRRARTGRRQPLLDGCSLQAYSRCARFRGKVCGLWLAVVCPLRRPWINLTQPWDSTVSPAAGPSRSSSAVLHR